MTAVVETNLVERSAPGRTEPRRSATKVWKAPLAGWRRTVAAIDEKTPAHRDRAIDAYRALATLGVFLGHWLVEALVLQPTGALQISSPLKELPGLAPASWFFQMLGLFFLVGGYASALSLRRSRERGETYGSWLRARWLRFGRPVIAAMAITAVALTALGAAGVAEGTLRTWVVLFIQPLWFIGIYGVVTALTKYAEWADRRLGIWAAAPLLATVAIVDVLRWGPLADSMPGWVALINLLPGWLFAYQLGVSWARGNLNRRAAWALLAGGAALFALLIGAFEYPASMVGVPGAERTNAHPPSLLVLALAATQAGAAVLLHGWVRRLMTRPALWAAAALLNLVALTIFCWHQVPLILTTLTGSLIGGDAVAGLTVEPGGIGWVLVRVLWLLVFGVLLAGIVALAKRFEGSWAGLPRWFGPAALTAAVAFVGYAVALY